MRTQPRFASAVARWALGVAALIAVLFVVGCGSSIPAQFSVTSTSGQLPQVVVNSTGYSATLIAANGTTPYMWAWSGNTPPGLMLSTSGVITGSPTATGTFNFTVTVTDAAGHTASANLSVSINPLLESVGVAPTSVTGGTSTMGTVTLASAAVFGAVVTLSSNNAAASVLASVTVAAGMTTANFMVTTTAVGSAAQPTITATYGVLKTTMLTVNPPTLSSVAVTLSSVTGGSSTGGTVTLNGPAPAGGAVVALTSSYPLVAILPTPPSVTVAAGMTTGTFTITTSAVGSAMPVTIGGTYNGGTQQTAVLTVNPPVLSSLMVTPPAVTGGTSTGGTVTLSGPAPAGGAVVALTSSKPLVAILPTPPSVTVAAGMTTGTFTITTSAVGSAMPVTIGGTYNGGTQQTAVLTVNPPVLSSLMVTPPAVLGGTSTGGTVTLSGPAPAGGAVVALTSSKPLVAILPTPPSVTVAAGMTTGTFTITTSAVGSAMPVTIGGTYNGGTQQTATLTVNPPPSLSISKHHVGSFSQGDTGDTYTVTVSNAAGSAATTAAVTVTEVPPVGMTITNLAGANGSPWVCTLGTLNCTRSDPLAGGASYDTITVTVSVSLTATADVNSLTNSVTVSGGGSAGANSSDPTTILAPSLMSINKSHTGNFSAGQTGATYTLTVSNAAGAGFTTGFVTVTEIPPTGLTVTGLAGGNGSLWACNVGTLSCTRSDRLAGGASYDPITVTVTVAGNAPASLTNQASLSGGNSPAPPNASNPTTIAVPALTITKSHSGGNFTQGEQGAIYTINVTNGTAAAGATVGTISVVDTPPTGFTVTSIVGSGGSTPWTCVLGTLTCTSTRSLTGGESDPITVTGNVATSATAPFVNTATLSGGGGTTPAPAADSMTALNPLLQITSTNSSLAVGTATDFYTTTLAATGGAPGSYMWSVTSGASNLTSANLTFSPTGVISGTPSSPGSVSFTAQVKDSQLNTTQMPLTITINPAPLLITTGMNSLPSDTVNVAYPSNTSLVASGGVSPYTWTLVSDPSTFPTGLNPLGTNGSITGTPTAPGTFTFTVQVADSETPPVTKQATLTITINSASCGANCMLSGTVSGPVVAGVTITLSGGPSSPAPTTTAADGTYGFTGLTAGTYTVTPSLPGYTYSPSGPDPATINANTVLNFTASSALTSYSISGTITYTGSQAGNTIIRVFQSGCTNCNNSVAGTSLHSAPSSTGTAYTVRGLGPGGYVVNVEVDTQNTGVQNSSDPEGISATETITSSNLTAVNITFGDRTPPAPSAPSAPLIFPSSLSALVVYNEVDDSNGEELATSYKISYGTDTGASSSGTRSYPAGNQNDVFAVPNLTGGGSYYFKLAAVNASGTSAYSSVVGPITINPPSGGNTVSGTITFTGITPAVGAHLNVGVFSGTSGVYFTSYPSPSSGQMYSVAGVPNGTYVLFAFLDQQNCFYICVGDVTNFVGLNGPPQINVSGATSSDIALTAFNAVTNVATIHVKFDPSVGGPDYYQVQVGESFGANRPVSMTLSSAPNVAVPFDMNGDSQNSFTPIFQNSVSPTVGDPYEFQVTFPGGSTQPIPASVTAVLSTFPTSLSETVSGTVTVNGVPVTLSSNVPEFTWAAPSPSPTFFYVYTVRVYNGNNQIWNYKGGSDGNGIPSNQTSVVFNADHSASQSSLTTGVTYEWEVTVTDNNGNTAAYITSYKP